MAPASRRKPRAGRAGCDKELRRERGSAAAQRGAGGVDGVGRLEGGLQVLAAAEALDVPRVGLAQPAGRADRAEVVDRAVDEPVELGEDLVARRVRVVGARAQQLLEEPGVAER